MDSDSKTSGESPKVLLAREAVSVLNQAIDKIEDHDIFSAKVMVEIAFHHLGRLQRDLDQHLYWEKKLKNTIKHES